MEDIKVLEVTGEEIRMAVLVEYYQSRCLYILRENGDVISTDNLNMIVSITQGENLTAEFIELFNVNLAELNDETFELYMDKVQSFLNKTQDLSRLDDPYEMQGFLRLLSDQEALLVIRHANCL